MPYIANTDADRKDMLEAIGCRDFDDLWSKAEVHSEMPDFSYMPAGKSEFEVMQQAQGITQPQNCGLQIIHSLLYDSLDAVNRVIHE